MLEKIPTSIIVITVAGVLLAGPVTVAAFWLGGSLVGAVVVAGVALVFVGLYIYTMRRYGGKVDG